MNLLVVQRIANCRETCRLNFWKDESQLVTKVLHFSFGEPANPEQVFLLFDIDQQHKALSEVLRIVDGFKYQHKNWWTEDETT